MSDEIGSIVKRLREIAPFLLPTSGWTVEERALPTEAANCIERLRAELAAEREREGKWMQQVSRISRRASDLREERDKLREALERAKPFVARDESDKADEVFAAIDAVLEETGDE